jgi:hypothetical protein
MTMKKIMLALVVLLAGAGVAKAQGYYQDDQGYDDDQAYDDQGYDDGYQDANYRLHGSASFGVFYDTLSPYGDWVYVGSYGRVWRPSAAVVGAGFRPYGTGGNWVYTDYGWSWESDYDWGWAPFHYGRWLLDPVYGWVWVPGDTWGPAWVDWRFGGGYVGWAPLAPYGVSVSYDAYSPWWVFVDSPHFCDYGVYRYAMPYNRAVTVAWPVTQPYRQTVAYGGSRFYAGPPAGHIARATGVAIAPVHVAAPRAGTIAAVQPRVTANPGVARNVAQSPYHAIASGRVAAAPNVATSRAFAPQGGIHAMPNAPARNVTPMPATPMHANPAPAPRPAAPAPAPRQFTPAPMHANPAPAPRPMTPAPTPRAFQPAPAPRAYQPAPAPRAYQPAPAPQQFHAAPAPQYRPAPAPQYRAAPAPQYRAAPAPQYHPAPAPQYRAAPAPQYHPAPRSNAAAAQPRRR